MKRFKMIQNRVLDIVEENIKPQEKVKMEYVRSHKGE
jgi:hypothetical protein